MPEVRARGVWFPSASTLNGSIVPTSKTTVPFSNVTAEAWNLAEIHFTAVFLAACFMNPVLLEDQRGRGKDSVRRWKIGGKSQWPRIRRAVLRVNNATLPGCVKYLRLGNADVAKLCMRCKYSCHAEDYHCYAMKKRCKNICTLPSFPLKHIFFSEVKDILP